MSGRLAGALLVAFALFSAACAAPPPGAVTVEVDLPAQAEVLEGEDFASAALYRSPYHSVHLVRVAAPLARHRHQESEETVYLLSGAGVLLMADLERPVRQGDLVVVPRNTVHGFRPTGEAPCVVLSVFTPAAVEGDRMFEE